MNYKNALEQLGFTEDTDFTITEGGFDWLNQEIPAPNETDIQTAWEDYLFSQFEGKNLVMLIDAYLKANEGLKDPENDSFNLAGFERAYAFNPNCGFWRFANIPKPTVEQLLALYSPVNKAALITEKYDLMNTEIYAEMYNVFKTVNPVSAQAFHATFQLMVSNPEMFSDKGLMVDNATPSYTVGAQLNTDEKIAGYAGERITQVNQYAGYRLQRIQQFYVERATIQGS